MRRRGVWFSAAVLFVLGGLLAIMVPSAASAQPAAAAASASSGNFTFAVNPIPPNFPELIQGTNWPPGLTVHVTSSIFPRGTVPATVVVQQDGTWSAEADVSATAAEGSYNVTAAAQGTVNGILTTVVVVHQLRVASIRTQLLECGLSPTQLVPFPFPTSIGDLLADLAHLVGTAATAFSCAVDVSINLIGGLAGLGT